MSAIPPISPIPPIETIRDALRFMVSSMGHQKEPISFGHGFIGPIEEGWALIAHALKLPVDEHSRDMFLDSRLGQDEVNNIIALLQRRINERLPVAYITGEAWLVGYRFRVANDVIVPRSLLAKPIVEQLRPWLEHPETLENIVELCCGSASLAILAALAFPHATVDAVDINEAALDNARLNVADYQLEQRVHLHQGDLFNALKNDGRSKRTRASKKYDLIIANPPYVPSSIMGKLPAEYRAEPSLALEGGRDGLDIVRRIIQECRPFLKADGFLLLEIGGNYDDFMTAYPDLSPVFLDNDALDPCILLLAGHDLGCVD